MDWLLVAKIIFIFITVWSTGLIISAKYLKSILTSGNFIVWAIGVTGLIVIYVVI